MQETIRLPVSSPDISLRLQMPTLTAARVSATMTATQSPEGIRWQGQAGTVRLTATCAPTEPNTWLIDSRLENVGPDAEACLALPYLIYHFDQDQPVRVFNPLFGGVLEATMVPIAIAYPGPAGFCLTAAAGLTKTVAVGILNEEQRHVTIRHVPAGMDGQIRFVFERVLVKRGDSVTLPRQFIAIGDDWAEAMAPYKDWFNATFHRTRMRPGWWTDERFSETRKAHCLAPWFPPEAVAGVWIFNDEGRPRTFEDVKGEIDAAIAEGEEQGFLPLFFQFAWWKNMADLRGLFMFDALCGDYTEAHDLTRPVVDYIHARGMRTYLYANMISAGDESATFRTRPDLFIRGADGFPVYNAGYPMLMFCPGAPRVRDYWEANLQYILNTLDADGIFLDQACGGFPPQYCYAPEHHHQHPDTYGRDFQALLDFIGNRAREIKPDCYLGGELLLDSRSLHLDESHGYGYATPHSTPPATVELQQSTPPAEHFIFSRYLCPQVYSQRGKTDADLMNGAAGTYASSLWQQYRPIFESSCRTCRVTPAGALAYLFGPVGGIAILAVRSHGNIGQVRITLPAGIHLKGKLAAGLDWCEDGTLACQAGITPAYYALSLE